MATQPPGHIDPRAVPEKKFHWKLAKWILAKDLVDIVGVEELAKWLSPKELFDAVVFERVVEAIRPMLTTAQIEKLRRTCKERGT